MILKWSLPSDVHSSRAGGAVSANVHHGLDGLIGKRPAGRIAVRPLDTTPVQNGPSVALLALCQAAERRERALIRVDVL
jgi:hypothetical protein